MPSRRRFLQASISLATPLVPLASRAQDVFPSRPIRIIVPYATGGITDILARLLAQPMEQSLGARVLVDNRPGAGGTLGTDLVAKAPADGYTIVLGALSPLVISKIATEKLAYDPMTDFAPVTQLASGPLVLVVHPSVPATTAKELVALLREKPDSLSYSSAGAGTPSHLCAELFKSRLGVRMTHVPYKGFGASLTDLLAGQVQLTFDSPASLLPVIKSGKLRALAVTSDSRAPLLPDVPSFAELGFGGLDVSGWYGLLVPAKTPAPVVEQLRVAAVAAVGAKEVSSKIVELGAVPRTGTSREFADLIAAEHARWLPIVKAIGLTMN
ncbi:MAG: Bug family tripartite tricarboxylate transporter substrate binding protein [Lautropia sp.]